MASDKYTVRIRSADFAEKDDKDIGYPTVGEFNFYIDDDVLDTTMLPNLVQYNLKATAYKGILSGTLEQLNFVGEAKMPTWDGNDWDTTQFTRNPAAIIRFILTSDLVNPRAESIDVIDNDSLTELYDWCEAEDYLCDGLITDEVRVESIIEDLLNNCQATFTFFNGKYFFGIDKDKPATEMFGQHNTYEFRYTPTIGRVTDALRISYLDNVEFKIKEITLYWYNDQANLVPEFGKDDNDYDIVFNENNYLTDEASIIKIGSYKLSLIQQKRDLFEFGVNLEALNLRLFDKIFISNTCNMSNSSTGLIKSLITSGGNITGFQLYSSINIPTDATLTIRSLNLSTQDIVINAFDVANSGVSDIITLDTPIPNNGIIQGKGIRKGLDNKIDWNYDGDLFEIGQDDIVECVVQAVRYNEDLTATIVAREA